MNDEGANKSLACLADKITQFKNTVNFEMSLPVLNTLCEYFHNIPDDVKETIFFQKVEGLNTVNLWKEDIDWVVKDFGFEHGKYTDWLVKKEEESELYTYIKNIINSKSIKKKKKLVILLSHFEPLIYHVIKATRKRFGKIKDVVRGETISDDIEISTKSIGKLYVLAETYIVFSNTDNYDSIDKRIPFRNNILHNGTLSYEDDDINEAYELLVKYICMLVWLEKYYSD